MPNFKNVDLLELVEEYALANSLISNEEELSNEFDRNIAEFVLQRYGPGDDVAMREAFNDWTDMLCKDGEIHEEQYNNYEYVGEHK